MASLDPWAKGQNQPNFLDTSQARLSKEARSIVTLKIGRIPLFMVVKWGTFYEVALIFLYFMGLFSATSCSLLEVELSKVVFRAFKVFGQILSICVN